MNWAKNNHHKCLRALIVAGTELKAIDKCENTALLKAVREGNGKCVDALLKEGVDVNIADRYNC